MKILITGGSGFIGKNIVEGLKHEYEVIAPTHRELDLLCQEEVFRCLSQGKFDAVVHCANTNQVVHPDDIGNVVEHDLRMLSNLTRYPELYKRFIYFGSGAEYDLNNYVPLMKEEYLGNSIPTDEYGFGKYIAAKLTESSANAYELCLFGVFGKYEEWRRRFISNIIYQCFANHSIAMNQHALFDYLYVEDLTKILKSFLDLDFAPRWHRYNVCSGKSVDLYEIADFIRQIIDPEIKICIASDDWKREYSGDNSRLLNELPDISLSPLKSSIEIMVKYYANNGFK